MTERTFVEQIKEAIHELVEAVRESGRRIHPLEDQEAGE